jgi:hypothetical protein
MPQLQETCGVLNMKGEGERENSRKPRFVMKPSAARIFPNSRVSARPAIQELHPTQRAKVRDLAKCIRKTQRCSNLMDLFCNEFYPYRKKNKQGDVFNTSVNKAWFHLKNFDETWRR